ncbi:MAG: hypothetical protein ACFFD1_00130 [Candidatus Thorarchaeota archaeon]
MATNQTISRLIRQTQEGLDSILTHEDYQLKSTWEKVFTTKQHDKHYYEFMQRSGGYLATPIGEGENYSNFQTIDQDFLTRKVLQMYEITYRYTFFAQRFNLYDNLKESMIMDGSKGHDARKDWDGADILNNGFTDTGPDGSALFANSHSASNKRSDITVDNRIDLDISVDALEQAYILIDKFYNPDGIIGQYEARKVVYPEDLQFDVKRILESMGEVGTANNTTNTMYKGFQGIKWKRLSDKDSYFVLTDCRKGLMCVENMKPTVKIMNDQNSPDVLIAILAIYRMLYEDFRLGVGCLGQ